MMTKTDRLLVKLAAGRQIKRAGLFDPKELPLPAGAIGALGAGGAVGGGVLGGTAGLLYGLVRDRALAQLLKLTAAGTGIGAVAGGLGGLGAGSMARYVPDAGGDGTDAIKLGPFMVGEGR